MSDEEMYALLSQAKAQIQADEQEIDALKTALAAAVLIAKSIRARGGA